MLPRDVYTRGVEPSAHQKQFALKHSQPYVAQRKRKAEASPWGAQPQEPPFKRKKTSDELAYEHLMSELAGPSSKPSAAPAAEVDPLDAFMASVESEVKQQKKEAKAAAEVDPLDAFMVGIQQDLKKKKKKQKGERLGLEENDVYQGEAKINFGAASDKDVYRVAKQIDRQAKKNKKAPEEVEYDENGKIIYEKNKEIEKLEPVDYNKVWVRKVQKDLYKEHPEVFAMDQNQCEAIRLHTGSRVQGNDLRNPVCAFAHFEYNFSEQMMRNIRKQNYERPTGIQCQAMPSILNGRDLIGVAKTGSGKTAAFLLPMICHIEAQDKLEPGDGPIAMIVAPTRELALQIHEETKKFIRGTKLVTCPIYGGMTMFEQKQTLERGCEIVVGTPGRIIDMLKKKHTNCFRLTYLVLDEADRMFSLGFESQVRSIIGQIRPTRQLLLFSATMNRKVRRLATDCLVNPINITIGQSGVANKDVMQVVEVVQTADEKFNWLKNNLAAFLKFGPLLIFCTTKRNCEVLIRKVKQVNSNVGTIHGDKGQVARQMIIDDFRKRKIDILIATDVAGRGLDIKGLNTVICFDPAMSIDNHIHRIGRTGRAGKQGRAYSILAWALKHDKKFASHLVKCLKKSKQNVSDPLLQLAGIKPRKNTGKSAGGLPPGLGNSTTRRAGQRVAGIGMGGKKRGKKGFTQYNPQNAQAMRSSFMTTFTSSGLQQSHLPKHQQKKKKSRWGS